MWIPLINANQILKEIGMSNSILSSWVYPWAKQTAAKANLDSVEREDRYQEIILAYVDNMARVNEVEASQGVEAAKAYMGMVVRNHLRNLNADNCTQLSGLNGTTRENESKAVKQAKRQAMIGGISLNAELGDDGESLSEIISDGKASIEDTLTYEAFMKNAGILAPLLLQQVSHPREWCEKFPQAATLFEGSPALREMAVREAAKKASEYCDASAEEIAKYVTEFLKTWRGERGDYGDGDDVESVAEFSPAAEVAEFFQEGSVMKAVSLCLPLNTIKEFRPGYGKFLIDLAAKEAKKVAEELTHLNSEEVSEFVDYCKNRAYSYLKSNGGLVKFDVAMERLQASLF